MAIIEDTTTHAVAEVAATGSIAQGDVAVAVRDPVLSSHPNTTAPVIITISDGSSTQSAALGVGAYVITSDIDVAFTVGANPTATTAKNKLWAKTYRWLQIVTANDKVAAIRINSDTGSVSIEKQS